MYIYIYTHTHMYMCMYVYIHASRLSKIIPLHYFYIKTIKLSPPGMPLASDLRNRNTDFYIVYIKIY